MAKIWNEIKYDLAFLRDHTLQPKWFKVFKVFILGGVLVGYAFWFGWSATLLFFATFVVLMLVVHFIYRQKTNKYTTSWLDFIVTPDSTERKPNRIGKYYYVAIVINASIAVIVNQLFTA